MFILIWCLDNREILNRLKVQVIKMLQIAALNSFKLRKNRNILRIYQKMNFWPNQIVKISLVLAIMQVKWTHRTFHRMSVRDYTIQRLFNIWKTNFLSEDILVIDYNLFRLKYGWPRNTYHAGKVYAWIKYKSSSYMWKTLKWKM